MLFHLKFGIFSLTFFNSWSSNSAHKDHPKAENPTTIQRKKNEIFPAQLLGFWCVLESGTRIHWLLGWSTPKSFLSGLLNEGNLRFLHILLIGWWGFISVFLLTQAKHLHGSQERKYFPTDPSHKRWTKRIKIPVAMGT